MNTDINDQAPPKYKVMRLASGRYRLSMNAGVDATNGGILWIRGCDTDFDTLDDATAGMHRLVNEQNWYFAEYGASMTGGH